jgi:hypothetical protein
VGALRSVGRGDATHGATQQDIELYDAACAGFGSSAACINQATYAACIEFRDVHEFGGMRELWELRGVL